MTIKLPERELDVPFSESESVSQYLSDHPDFFDHNPELLNKMHVPHVERGSAVSLVERQVKNLRSNNHELNQQLQELLDIARENDQLADRLHRFTLALLECDSLENVLSTIKVKIVEDFEIDQVVIKFDQMNPLNSIVNEPKDLATGELLEKIFSTDTAPTCFIDPDKGCFQELFNLQSQDIRSSVVLPLGGRLATGLLALGSTDKQRFWPGMNTTFLNRLADLINRILTMQQQK